MNCLTLLEEKIKGKAYARKRYTVYIYCRRVTYIYSNIIYIYILQTCNIYIYSNHNSEKNLEREKNLIEMDARASYGLLQDRFGLRLILNVKERVKCIRKGIKI